MAITTLRTKQSDHINQDIIDKVRSVKLNEAFKATTNCYLAQLRSILIRSRDEC